MTHPKPPAPLDSSDLSIRARRGALPDEEQRAFEQALEASATLRYVHGLGRDFDEELRVRPSDDELIQRASARVLAPSPARPAKRRALVVALAASAVIASAAAATGVWFSEQGGPQPPDRVDAPQKPALRQPAVQNAESPGAVPEARVVAPTRSEPRVGSRERAGAVRALPSAVPVEEATAASLFREANAARRAGDFTRAAALYTELQARYPGASQARVSRVSLGKLLLAAGRTRDAERQFRLYLESGDKTLDEEALVGRAEAFARNGERGEERRIWQELLRRHGASVYAPRARERLESLGSGADAPRPR